MPDHYGKRLLWEKPCCTYCIEPSSASLHLNLPRLCFHTKWQPFPPPTRVPELSWAWQLVPEFAGRWHRAWLGCSLDSCPNRRSAAQVLNRKWAKHCTSFPVGLSDKILRIWMSVLIFSIFIVYFVAPESQTVPLNLRNAFELHSK